ncbi:hypothetical protein PIROE2DRAFT_19117 [Piromyces sp. E2]|nr:hypothetical protein PIROE2DRAFT_19117 [Piromyces sp. E2]|eukprot:OUM56322.1 hypothetical protein PIROE2DRAFT_19117 [Piromyces sp. E2]
MASTKILTIVYFISVISLCLANLTDYLKGTDRTFNEIEGKVLDFNISMSKEVYDEFIENAQLTFPVYYGKYHGQFPDEMKKEFKVNLNITLGNEVYSFDKVGFKIGGSVSRTCVKLGYNLKLKNKQSFLGRKNLRLKADIYDITHIRSKLGSDLMNKWNLPSIQESYSRLYINGKYMGFYFLTDSIKPNWIKEKYHLPETEEVKTLYNCKKMGMKFYPEAMGACVNEKEEYLNYTQPLVEMVQEVVNYSTVDQLKNKFDVDTLRKQMITEYLLGSYDHFLIAGHNYHLYQQPNGLWQVIARDLDTLFLGQIEMAISKGMPLDIKVKDNMVEYAKAKFEDWYSESIKKPFVDAIYYNDKKTFRKVLKEMLITDFNKYELFPRIDELAKFVAPYVKEDITRDENGNMPGFINEFGQRDNDTYTMEMFWGSVNYLQTSRNIGVKHFIDLKFDAVCKHFNFNKKEILREAKIYQKKRETQRLIDEVKAELDVTIEEYNKLKNTVVHSVRKLKEKNHELKKIKKNIDKLNKKLKKLQNKYKNY